MRILVLFFVLLGFTSFVQADELEKAYQKEYAYLVAEKKSLENRLVSLQQSNKQTLRTTRNEIASLQQDYLAQKNLVDRLNQQITDASRNADFAENDTLLLETTLLQAKESLNKVKMPFIEKAPVNEQLSSAFKNADQIIRQDSGLNRGTTEYFQLDGTAVQGEVLNVGRIAKFGLGDTASGALAPSGSGMFKLWDNKTAATTDAFKTGQTPSSIDIFLYDSPDNAVEKQDERGLMDDITAGGLIGKVIIAIGLAGLILVAIRMTLLILFSSDIQKKTVSINEEIQRGSIESAIEACKKNLSSASRVIAATLRNIERERDHIEDIISESILYESSRIDRFGSAILVIAAVAPLLGLLGTVTGMISTFDIITEFGTGDPKLLSTGISEALITTKFGLIVAIPMLLLGNVLSSWATRTKNDLERAALSMINTHKVQA